jgi:hypothetical protein
MKHDRHGLSNHPLYHIWASMMGSCYNKDKPSYNSCGKIGITVCKEWREIENFIRDMGRKPINTCLSRHDSNKNFSKENCYWKSRVKMTSDLVIFILKEYYLEERPLKEVVQESGASITAVMAVIKVHEHSWGTVIEDCV